jgi:hypothetical protein
VLKVKIPECMLGVTWGIGAKFQSQPFLAATRAANLGKYGPLRQDNQQLPNSSAKDIVIAAKVSERKIALGMPQ